MISPTGTAPLSQRGLLTDTCATSQSLTRLMQLLAPLLTATKLLTNQVGTHQPVRHALQERLELIAQPWSFSTI